MLVAGIDGLFDVVYALGAFVTVVITGTAIGYEDDEFSSGPLGHEQLLIMAQHCAIRSRLWDGKRQQAAAVQGGFVTVR